MAISMYQASIPLLQQMLGSLRHVLERGEAYAKSRSIDPQYLVRDRLAPDMLPLVKQVQIASDNAKGIAARLAGITPPSYADDETTFAELYARIDKTLQFLRTIDAGQVDGSEERDITLPLPNSEPLKFKGQGYLMHFGIPNFLFHVTMAYAILRHNGVDIGKRDFMGGGRKS